MSPILATAAAIVAFVALLAVYGEVVHEHDAKVIAVVAASEAAKVADAQHAQDERTIANLTTANNTAVARLNTLAALKETIHAAPQTNTCATAPAVVALVRGLRGTPGGGHAGTTATSTR